MITTTEAVTAYRASGRAVAMTTDTLTDDEGILPPVVVQTPATFVVHPSLLGVLPEMLDEDEGTEAVEALLDSIR